MTPYSIVSLSNLGSLRSQSLCLGTKITVPKKAMLKEHLETVGSREYPYKCRWPDGQSTLSTGVPVMPPRVPLLSLGKNTL